LLARAATCAGGIFGPLRAARQIYNAMRRDPEQLERTQQDAWDQRNSDPTGAHADSGSEELQKKSRPPSLTIKTAPNCDALIACRCPAAFPDPVTYASSRNHFLFLMATAYITLASGRFSFLTIRADRSSFRAPGLFRSRHQNLYPNQNSM
jgi:hypothetical protein